MGDSPPPDPSIANQARGFVWSPERAVKDGLMMLELVEQGAKQVTVTAKRRAVWDTEIAELKKMVQKDRSLTTMMVAVCGATGAGKSSLLNAILEDNVVPTSGMRACTSVVTKISHHKRKDVRAEISFITKEEWYQELSVIVKDLADDGGHGTTEEAKIARDKIQAVYPGLELTGWDDPDDFLVQLFEHHSLPHARLGTTETITAKDSASFHQKIAKYIDSVPIDSNDPKDYALWPLIKEVNIFHRAKVLSTGLVLVDLPGSADSNAARDSIAKKYLKEAHRVWIMADITRAVDNQTAKKLLGKAFRTQLLNGNYDDKFITFIATKTDDVSNSEIAKALKLENDPEYAKLQEVFLEHQTEKTRLERKRASLTGQITKSDKEKKSLNDKLKGAMAKLKRGKGRSTRGKAKRKPPPRRGAAAAAPPSPEQSAKRKAADEPEEAGPAKRTRQSNTLLTDFWDSMPPADDSDDELNIVDGSDESGGEEEKEKEKEDPPAEEEEEEEPSVTVDESQTPAALRDSIKEALEQLKVRREELVEERKAVDESLVEVKKLYRDALKEKNAFSSKARNEFSKETLKRDFRMGVREMDDRRGYELDPDAFDPTHHVRDYEALDLPVFTCSSRDYMRLKGYAHGDGEAACFSDVQDTEIPALQEWCHQLTLEVRDDIAKEFLTRLLALAKAIYRYLEQAAKMAGTGYLRQVLRAQWETPKEQDGEDRRAASTGIQGRMQREFTKYALRCARELKTAFKDGIEGKCHEGVVKARNSALETVTSFETMHHATYRATIRRDGHWRRDMNYELIDPFTSTIAHSFNAIFENNVLGSFKLSIQKAVKRLIHEFRDTLASSALKDAAETQGRICHSETENALKQAMDAVKVTVTNQRREISRAIAPTVQNRLLPGYQRAKMEQGKGCVARQKAHMREFTIEHRDTMFQEAADGIMDSLEDAADAVAITLDTSLKGLGKKIEVALSVLWEDVKEDPEEAALRAEVLETVSKCQRRVSIWLESLKQKIERETMEEANE